MAATTASILSAIYHSGRMIEKAVNFSLKITGKEQPIKDIIKDSAEKNFRPLFRGTVPLMGHSLNPLIKLVGQPATKIYTT